MNLFPFTTIAKKDLRKGWLAEIDRGPGATFFGVDDPPPLRTTVFEKPKIEKHAYQDAS
tara:strand:+ start:1139 stop:1315 length:177 start_codon:yes stop_codon:yes gene_type:complete